MLDYATRYLRAGLSVIPVSPTDKIPKINWRQFQNAKPSPSHLNSWFTRKSENEVGIAVIGGSVSGGLEIMDFDCDGYFEKWFKTTGPLVETLRLPVQRTGGGGWHVLYRTATPGRNRILAWQKNSKVAAGKEVAIEIRGTGGCAVLAPSLHPCGQPYRLMSGSLEAIPTISPTDQETLIIAASGFDEAPKPKFEAKPYQSRVAQPGTSVIDTFNLTFGIEELLLAHGYQKRGEKRFARPKGESASVLVKDNKSFHHSANDPLFSTYWQTPFNVMCWFECNGDVKAGVREAVLRIKGYRNVA